MTETKGKLQVRDEEEAQADVEIWKYVFGFTNMAVVKCAIDLGIADAIEKHEGSPITLEELSSSLGCEDPSSLYRIMRFLVHQNIFKEKPITTQLSGSTCIGYVQSPLSSRLIRGGENSMADFILMESSPFMLASWGRLNKSILLGNGRNAAAFEGVHGDDLWKFTAANPGDSKLFDDAMASDARMVVPAIVESCPEVFDHGIKTLIDIGGGNGTALSLLVKAFPWIQGINFDLPHVVSVAPKRDRVKHVGGDMFKSIPCADAAFLMWVLHDWNDDECIQILKNCKEAICKDKGKVIIVEAIVGEKKEEDKFEYVRLMLDMVMMAHTSTGKERTSMEWEHVLLQAGFTRYNIRYIGAVQFVIEASP